MQTKKRKKAKQSKWSNRVEMPWWVNMETRKRCGEAVVHLSAREAHMFDKAPVLMGQENHVGGSLLEMYAWYWMNKLAVSSVNKACWPQFPLGGLPSCCIIGIVLSFFWIFLKLCLAETHDAPCYFIEEALECTQECPSVCLLTLMITQMLTKTFCWGSVGSLPGETWGCHTGYLDILDLNGNRGAPVAQGGLVTWVPDLDPQINFCCVSSPRLFL